MSIRNGILAILSMGPCHGYQIKHELEAHLAAQSEHPLPAGLATLNLFAGDVCDQPLAPKDGWLEVKRVTPSAAKLELFAAEDHRQDWWFERLARCHALL